MARSAPLARGLSDGFFCPFGADSDSHNLNVVFGFADLNSLLDSVIVTLVEVVGKIPLVNSEVVKLEFVFGDCYLSDGD